MLSLKKNSKFVVILDSVVPYHSFSDAKKDETYTFFIKNLNSVFSDFGACQGDEIFEDVLKQCGEKNATACVEYDAIVNVLHQTLTTFVPFIRVLYKHLPYFCDTFGTSEGTPVEWAIKNENLVYKVLDSVYEVTGKRYHGTHFWSDPKIRISQKDIE